MTPNPQLTETATCQGTITGETLVRLRDTRFFRIPGTATVIAALDAQSAQELADQINARPRGGQRKARKPRPVVEVPALSPVYNGVTARRTTAAGLAFFNEVQGPLEEDAGEYALPYELWGGLIEE